MVVKKIIKYIISGLVPLLLVTGCGNDANAPDDGLVFISPTGVSITATAPGDGCTLSYPPINFEVASFNITILDRNGFTVPGIDIQISPIYSLNTGGGLPAFFLFDDEDGNGNNDGRIITDTGVLDDAELVSGLTDPFPYATNTGPTGTKRIWYAYNSDPDCAFSGDIQVFSGKLGNKYEFKFTAS